MIERLGFKDVELTTPEHDKMFLQMLDKTVMWKVLNNGSLEIARNFKWSWREPGASKQPCPYKIVVKDKQAPFLCRLKSALPEPRPETCLAQRCYSLNFKHPRTYVHSAEHYGPNGKDYLETPYCERESLQDCNNAKLVFCSKENCSEDIEWKNFFATFPRPSVLHLHEVILDKMVIEGEHVIVNSYNKFVIGVVDFLVTFENVTDVDGTVYGMWKPDKYKVVIEIKPRVTSIGETLRQLNVYRSFFDEYTDFLLVTRTKGLKDVLKGQGIMVYEWTTEDNEEESS